MSRPIIVALFNHKDPIRTPRLALHGLSIRVPQAYAVSGDVFRADPRPFHQRLSLLGGKSILRARNMHAAYAQ